ncbi:MAG: hypothetical protein JW908_04540 [Anaerolineales bacterium]|nr:hypothetical protein [Anaerolineales bacterium]
MRKNNLRFFVISFIFLCLIVLFTPLEKTLGANSRLVFFHGALAWTAIIMFTVAGLAGLYGFIVRRDHIHIWSRAIGHVALALWLIFLPMSLLVMQVTWNGLFLDEPRFRIPFNFAVVGLILHIGLIFLPAAWTSATNFLYAVTLIISLRGAQSVLHPVSPISQSNALGIQIYFSGIFLMLLIIAGQSARQWYGWLQNRQGKAAQ